MDEDREVTRLAAPVELRAATLAFHPKGNRLAVATREGRLLVLDVNRGQVVFDDPSAHPFGVAVLGWDTSGKQLISWGILEGSLKCWEVSEPPVVACQTGLRSGQFAISPDNQLLALSYRDGALKLCRVRGGEQLFRCRLRPRAISQLRFTADGATLALSDGDGTVQLLNLHQLRQGLETVHLDW